MVHVAKAVGCAAIAIVLMAGCSAAPSPTPEPAAASIVILGDSLSVDPAVNCDVCTSWVAQFASTLDQPVDVHDEAQPGSQIAGVLDQLSNEAVIAELASATVVVVWIGNNEGPPWNEDTPCATPPGDTAEDQVAAVEGYSQECIDSTMTLYSGIYADLFTQITALSPHAETRLALTIHSNWADNPSLSVDEFGADRITTLLDRLGPIFDEWNAGLCTAAESSGFECVDAHHAINGPDGRAPATAFVGSDFTHLSQAGHDTIAQLLAAAR